MRFASFRSAGRIGLAAKIGEQLAWPDRRRCRLSRRPPVADPQGRRGARWRRCGAAGRPRPVDLDGRRPAAADLQPGKDRLHRPQLPRPFGGERLQAAGFPDDLRPVQFEPHRAWRRRSSARMSPSSWTTRASWSPIIGKTARDVAEAQALDHVAGYSIFNDGSIRDYQFKAPQWTPGKNFDDTGAFGPWFVTADELPPGCEGLRLTRPG